MKTSELKQKVNEILKRNDVKLQHRSGKTQIGEIWTNYVALYGDFVTYTSSGAMLEWNNDNLLMSKQSDDIVATLRAAGLIVHSGYSYRMEILIEVDKYWSADDDYKTPRMDFRTESRYKGMVGRSYKHSQIKIVKSK